MSLISTSITWTVNLPFSTLHTLVSSSWQQRPSPGPWSNTEAPALWSVWPSFPHSPTAPSRMKVLMMKQHDKTKKIPDGLNTQKDKWGKYLGPMCWLTTCPNLDVSLNARTLLRKAHQGACLSPTCSSGLAPGAPHYWTWHRAGLDPNQVQEGPRGHFLSHWPVMWQTAVGCTKPHRRTPKAVTTDGKILTFPFFPSSLPQTLPMTRCILCPSQWDQTHVQNTG